MVNIIVLILVHEGLSGKDVIKTCFALTRVTVPYMTGCFGVISGNNRLQEKGWLSKWCGNVV